MSLNQTLTLAIFLATYVFALGRWVKIGYVSMISALLLLVLGILSPREALTDAVRWDVLGIYWGFMMISIAFADSGVPKLLAERLLAAARTERQVILSLVVLGAFLSAWMENVGVVLMIAPVAIEISRRLRTPLLPYMVVIAISANAVTTVSMVADPPALILALETGMKFGDFYWFLGRPGLGTITVIGVVVALSTLSFQFSGMKKRVELHLEEVPVTYGASALFVLSVVALGFGQEYGLSPGVVGLFGGGAALWVNRGRAREMFINFDWNSFFFIIGIFVVVYSLRAVDLLSESARLIHGLGLKTPGQALAWITWASVALSSFIDNVPFTMLMIPVCLDLARLLGSSPWPLLFGMLIGTGTGGNITPVGATANIFAIGVLEKHGDRVPLRTFMKISVPFTLAAVGTAHLLLALLWLD